MKKVDLLYEGKAKKVFTTEDPDILIVDYKDDATAFDGLKKGTIVGKGAINNRMTNHIFKLFEKEGIPTHYIEELSDRETAVKKVEIVPLEVIIRNISAGSFAKKMGVEEGIVFKRPTLEFSYKNDDLHDPFINDKKRSFDDLKTHIFKHIVFLHGTRPTADLPFFFRYFIISLELSQEPVLSNSR